MEPTSSSNLRPRLTGVLWGDSKAGKTTFAMTLPGRKLLVNFDPEGFASVAHRTDFDVFDLSALAPTDAVQQARKVAMHIIENKDQYGSVILDSLTTLAEAATYDAVARGIGKSTQFTPTLDAPGLGAYGARNNTFNDIVSRLLRATAQTHHHCFFIAHSDDPEYDKDGKNIIQQTIMLSSKMRQTTSLKSSEIYHMNMVGNERHIFLAPFGVKKPMGSRMFDTEKCSRFILKYDVSKKDHEQPHTLANFYETWIAQKQRKLLSIPTTVANTITDAAAKDAAVKAS